MSHINDPVSLTFLCKPNDISSSLINTARNIGVRVAFDLGSASPAVYQGKLLVSDASKDTVDLKISPALLSDPGLISILREIDVARLWVELEPAFVQDDIDALLNQITSISNYFNVIPIVSDADLILKIIEGFPEIGSFAIKGNEASGFVGSETLLTLFSLASTIKIQKGSEKEILIWGGISYPEVAAAFVACGAKGIVFESLHWLTDLMNIDEECKKRIANLRADHTELVGGALGVFLRLYNKGNSKSVKELKAFVGSLCGAEVRDEQRTFFVKHVSDKFQHPRDSDFARDELIPLGVEAAFALSFVRRYGDSTETALSKFKDHIEMLLRSAVKQSSSFADSDAAREMGTHYPFIQGAMSWITDCPEFSLEVSKAGALPTLALGLMDFRTLEQKFSGLDGLMGERPYAVNIITLAENPYREEQIEWVKSKKPRFVVIAAGEPSHAKSLTSEGIEAIYIAPNEELLRLALENGIKFVVLEGHEAGGHVGTHSSITLAQIALELKDRQPALFKDTRMILAGGFFNRLTAVIASIIGVDGLQMGTVYLSSREIVETGALHPIYQKRILESPPGATIVTGESSGLRVRSLKSAKIEAICSLERDFVSGSQDESSFRKEIEALSAGSLFVAARGMDRPDGKPLNESAILEQGQFMSGACAGMLNQPVSLIQIHENLAVGLENEPFTLTESLYGSTREPNDSCRDFSLTKSRQTIGKTTLSSQPIGSERIAITAMSIVNSLGNSPASIIRASLDLKSGIVPVPSSKWNHESFFNSRVRAPEKTYCRFGAFQDLEISRKELGIPPQDFRTMAESTKVTMWLARNAILESGILESNVPMERIGVLISQNSGEAASTLEEMIIRGCSKKILSDIKNVINLNADQELAINEEIRKKRLAVDDTTLLGRLNCSAGGFICNKYGFMGPSFSVSAACATSLVALYSAYQMIRNGVIDAAVVGGGEELLTPMHFLEFSALGALAGLSGINREPSESSRPFDLDRDGMVLGEGGAMIVIERESVARSRGASIFALITSMGASNNNQGMVESSRETQELAIKASFKDSRYGPESVDLVECHATSTKQGDMEEAQGLKSIFTNGRPPVLASFKSQIGHTLGASGLNSMIRGIMAMREKTLPPTKNYSKPDPEINLESDGFRVLAEPDDWASRNGDPRRIQVNAFGFGGSNYVVQIEESRDEEATRLVTFPEENKIPKVGRTEASLPEGIYFFNGKIADTECRISVIADSESSAIKKIKKEDFDSCESSIGDKRLKTLARQGIYLGVIDDAVPKMAFVFPGQGSHYAGMGNELYNNFPVIRKWMDKAADVAEFDLLKLLFFDKEEDLQKTRWQQPALFTLEFAMAQYLVSLGVHPFALAGHSLGELTALCLAGVYSFEDAFRIVNKRAVCMDKACKMNVDPGVMVACDAPLDLINELIKASDGLFVTNINSPRQIVIGGNTEESKTVASKLKEMGYRSTVLRVSMAFHSPIMRCIHDELKEFIDGIDFYPPEIPVISNTTMRPFPQDTEEIKTTVMAHLESPVQWLQNVHTLWNEFGVRLFVEVGPREILTNMIQDTIEEAACIQTCLPSAESLMFKTAMAQLYAKGALNVSQAKELTGQSTGGGENVPMKKEQELFVEPVFKNLQSSQNDLREIIQSEINTFIIETFGKFIKPAVLTRVRQLKGERFSENDLDREMLDLFGIGLVSTTSLPPLRNIESPRFISSGSPEPSLPETAPSEPDTTETIIQIIMEVTGYERDEIEPHMDLREDLSIRSSRLPVIMDSVESRFGIKVELEDFMDVRTIKDLSDRLELVLSRKTPSQVVSSQDEQTNTATVVHPPGEQIKRLIFTETLVQNESFQPLELSPLDSIIIIGPATSAELCRNSGDVFRRDYGVNIKHIIYSVGEKESNTDLLSEGGLAEIRDLIQSSESLAGVVFITDETFESRIADSPLLSECLLVLFRILQEFVEKHTKKMALFLQIGTESPSLFMEAATGMFLSLAIEFGSVHFRTMFLDYTTELRMAIRSAMDKSKKPTQLICRSGELLALEGRVCPISFGEEPAALELGEKDVILISGGLSGICAFLGEALAPFGCKLVFVGRTSLEERPGLEAEREKAFLTKKVLEQMRSKGIDAHYFQMDITDPNEVNSVIETIERSHGSITGVIHGAGLLRDNFMKRMTPEDFSEVVRVKFLGALNILQSLDKGAVKFVVGLSSAAAIQGNPGQVNYAAGNRLMSSYLKRLKTFYPKINVKALILPPIEGAGMAEDVEIRELMKRMNASYMTLGELSGMFLRELLIAPKADVWSLFMKNLPILSTAPLDTKVPAVGSGNFYAGPVVCKKSWFPMIDSVTDFNMDDGLLKASRIFDQNKDLWVNDHKPFKFLKHPIVSAIMALETFMEGAKLLFPYLTVVGVKEARFLDMMECPSNKQVSSQIQVRKVSESFSEKICEATLFTVKEEADRDDKKPHTKFKALIILASRLPQPAESFRGFPIQNDELDSRPMENAEVDAWYADRSDLKGRYRVMERLCGTGPDCVIGEFVYERSDDFSKPLHTKYQFSPYLFEAFMHVINFYLAMRDDNEKRILIPFGIDELQCFRKISNGEKISLQARKESGDEKGVKWDALGIDQNGMVVMYAKGVTMRWISKMR